jgi:excisionase family DNA binding protein
MRKLLRPKEAAQYLGLSVPTLARWRLEGGRIRFVRLGRAVLYDPADLESYIDANKRSSASEFTELDPPAPAA